MLWYTSRTDKRPYRPAMLLRSTIPKLVDLEDCDSYRKKVFETALAQPRRGKTKRGHIISFYTEVLPRLQTSSPLQLGMIVAFCDACRVETTRSISERKRGKRQKIAKSSGRHRWTKHSMDKLDKTCLRTR